MMMQSDVNHMTKQRLLQTKGLSKEVRGGKCILDALFYYCLCQDIRK